MTRSAVDSQMFRVLNIAIQMPVWRLEGSLDLPTNLLWAGLYSIGIFLLPPLLLSAPSQEAQDFRFDCISVGWVKIKIMLWEK